MFPKLRQGYEPVRNGSGDDESGGLKVGRRFHLQLGGFRDLLHAFRESSPLISHTIVAIVTSILWGGLFLLLLARTAQDRRPLLKPPPTSKAHDVDPYGTFAPNADFVTCGASIAEAKLLGCTYDILSNHYVPRACMDYESIAEYQADGSWFGFADENRTQLLTIEEMGERTVYHTSERDHIVHCAMLWRKQYRAFAERRANVDFIIASWDHTMHCSQFLIDMTDKGGPDWRNTPIDVIVGQAGCWVGR